MPGAPRTLAAASAEAIRKALSSRPIACGNGLTAPMTLSAGVRYDSGLVTGVSPQDLLADSDNAFAAPFIKVHGGTDLDPNRIKERTIANFSVGIDLDRHHVPLTLEANLLNAFDTQGVYNILSVFGGTHVIPPRTLAVRARYRFGKS